MNDWDKPIDQETLYNSLKHNIYGLYAPPVQVFINQMHEQIMEQREDGIYTKVVEQYGVDIDKEELKKALAYDRDQYRQGYEAGRADGYIAGSQDILHAMIDILKENGYKVELDD